MSHASVTTAALVMRKRTGQVAYEHYDSYEVPMDPTNPHLSDAWAATVMHGALVDKFGVSIDRKLAVDLGNRWETVGVSTHVTVSCGHSLDSLRGARDVALHLALEAASVEQDRAVRKLQADLGAV